MILAGHRPRVILVDVRQATAVYLAEHFSDLYNFELSHLFNKRVTLDYQYHSIFVLKGNKDSSQTYKRGNRKENREIGQNPVMEPQH